MSATAISPVAMNGTLPSAHPVTWGVRDLGVSIEGRNVLRGVSLQVRSGEIVAVVGGDGSGKTTLLRALVGAIATSAGTVERPPERALGYVSAAPGGYGDLSVDENLDFAARAYGVPAAERRARTDALLDRANLRAARDRLGDQLSGGMRRKLALAMAVTHQPELLVLDEPSTGVDPVGRAELWRLMTSLAAEGTAIVFSTTYLDEAERAAHVLVLADGRPLLEGTPDALLAAMPGVIGASDRRPEQGRSWRDGTGWRTWLADGTLPTGLGAVRATLEDVVIVAQIALEATTLKAATAPGVAASSGAQA